MQYEQLIELDRKHVWHPYSALGADLPIFPVKSAQGVRIHLQDGRDLIDGMSSWWSAIHGYNHPAINQALTGQMAKMAHVMFGGLTHAPAVELATRLVDITPEALQTVFFADSGSVATEVAMKMAIQYWHARSRPEKKKMLTVFHGYHGDTFGAMSVSDPVNGMHGLFAEALVEQRYIEAPSCRFDQPATPTDLAPLREVLEKHHGDTAAVILEPIVQGAGGMRFYSPDYLKQVKALCREFDTLLILDEIATGFGRTGRMFACEHAGVTPDILCLGKALTGGYMTLAAVLTTLNVAETIGQGEPGLFMHGPTFMANPLACTAALASLKLLLDSPWQDRIRFIEQAMTENLATCRAYDSVRDVRVLGAIGVVEMHEPVDMKTLQPRIVEAGIWVRPFGRLIYLMPPYIINSGELDYLTGQLVQIISEL